MTDVYRFSEIQMLLFFLVLVRMTAFVVSWPVFNADMVSRPVKILFALILTFVVFPGLTWTPVQEAVVKSDLIILVLREVFIGLSLGYLAQFFFFAFRIAGEMISQAMGLSAAQVFNPSLGGNTSAVEQFYVSFATLFYLAVNGHHFLISGLVQTFELAPAAQLALNTSEFANLGIMVQQIMELGVKFSAPVVISILTVNMVLGVVGKTVPQLNVLITSFPLNIMVGLLLMLVTLPMWLDQMGPFLDLSTAQVFRFVKAF